MSGYVLTTLMGDSSVRNALDKALYGDGRLSYNDVRAVLKSTLDGGAVSEQEYNDVKTILKKAKTLDQPSKDLIESFLKIHYRPVVKTKPQPAGQLTKNFNLSEFACKDGTAVPERLMENVKLLAKNLQVIRDKLQKPIKINSSYRTPTHNKKIGGASNSQHLYAKAADIVVANTTPVVVKRTIEGLIKSGKITAGGIGLYQTFVHYDIRGKNARW